MMELPEPNKKLWKGLLIVSHMRLKVNDWDGFYSLDDLTIASIWKAWDKNKLFTFWRFLGAI